MTLSPREQEVANQLKKGLSNREIGEAIFISESTVRWHAAGIYKKLGVHARTQAILALANLDKDDRQMEFEG